MAIHNRISTQDLEAKRWPYYLIYPMTSLLVLWAVLKKKLYGLFRPRKEVNFLLFDGIGKYGKVIKRNVTGWRAVDLIYNHRFGETKSIGGRLDDFWFDSLNCQAARNRFKLAKRELEKAILNTPASEVRVLSLASGTGQIESETLANVRDKNVNVKAVLIDREAEALERAEHFISSNGVSESIKLINSDVMQAIEIAKEFNPHIIQMVAFLDYLQEQEAIDFLSDIYGTLPEGGYFIASNTMPNLEMHFVKEVVGWPLIYRNHEEIGRIFEKSGFKNAQIIDEPLGIQNMIVAKKQAG